jgi:hypothetical protein
VAINEWVTEKSNSRSRQKDHSPKQTKAMQLTANGKHLPFPRTQTLRIMKLLSVFLLAAFLQVSARSTAQVTLSERKAPLERILRAIKQQSGYDLVYDKLLLTKKALPVDIDVRNVTAEQALALVFRSQPLSYEIVDRIISVKEKTFIFSNHTSALPPEER